ncbi:DUF6154 family protein [Alteribacillus bidgolensis]|uniref:Uncharacterized protein n=1 Tax=Alteribacillus bidgolensis TaxID=930129 RepID=A0A1G8I7C5_9BACI|nr:DUF6154 family protein [Alteribacillus bidgolensis]SDI14744.1 hypothetical protein SAMN05216352_10566 [Alteribacillus bidgolensis]
MEFVDNLYELYKNKLTGDEEDALIIIEGIMQSFSRKDMIQMIDNLSEQERFDMLALFLYEKFRQKMAEEGIGQTKNRDDENVKYYH